MIGVSGNEARAEYDDAVLEVSSSEAGAECGNTVIEVKVGKGHSEMAGSSGVAGISKAVVSLFSRRAGTQVTLGQLGLLEKHHIPIGVKFNEKAEVLWQETRISAVNVPRNK